MQTPQLKAIEHVKSAMDLSKTTISMATKYAVEFGNLSASALHELAKLLREHQEFVKNVTDTVRTEAEDRQESEEMVEQDDTEPVDIESYDAVI